MITNIFHKIRFAILKRKIKKNPYIGKEDSDGTYLYKEGDYNIRYRIVKLPDGQLGVDWIFLKRRLTNYEERIRRTKNKFFDFWHYQKWLIFFRPPILLILIMGIILFYSEVMETQEIKTKRFKWLIASAVGVTPQDVQYIGNGNIEISGQRKRSVDGINEPIRYAFNPLRWLFSSEGGILTRWRGEPFGYTQHSVVFNDKGDVWIKKKDAPWQHGIITGQDIKWDTPVGSSRVVDQEKIFLEDKRLKIIDK